MKLRLDRDLVFLDLEATGLDPLRDRIVQIALIRLRPSGDRSAWDSLVNPEIPIPPETTAIHHITDEMARSAPAFKQLAPAVLELLKDADLGGFGAARYDLPLLVAEFKRAGMSFDVNGRRIVDALHIFQRMEPRNLGAAYRFYCGKLMQGAHDARADTEAALDVFLAQVERYQGLDERPDLPTDIRGLHEFCSANDPKSVDSRGKFIWRHGAAAFNFGKYQTRPLHEVVLSDRSYVEWLAKGDKTSEEVAEICRQALRGTFPKKV